MFSQKNSYLLEKLTLERTANPEHYTARRHSNNSIIHNTDVQEQVHPTTFKPFLGSFYIFLHSFFNQLCSVIIKTIPYIGPCQLSLIRNICVFVGILPIVAYRNDKIFGERKYRFHLFLRAFYGATGALFEVMTYTYLPLAEASIIMSMLPIATSVAALVMLKEPFGVAQSISLVLTVCGVLTVLRIPEQFRNKKHVLHFDSTYIAGLMAALGTVLFYALGTVYVRKVKTVHYSIVVLYLSATGMIETSLLNGIFIPYVLSQCGWDQVLYILFGVFSLVINYAFTMGVQAQPAGLASVEKSSFDILTIIVLQAIFLKVYPDLYVICGACIVIVSLTILGIKNWILLMPESSNIRRKLRFLL